jgi:endonuclease/exonuclease/phosphatase (EEP) superfamily protein YafD
MWSRTDPALPPLGVLVAAALSVAAGCAGPPPAARPAPTSPLVRVLTYNVNFGIAGDPETIAAIRAANADLVLLQETNVAWERSLRAALAAELPHMAFRHRGGAGGMAVLSRLPLLETEFLSPNGDGWFPAVRVVVETGFGRLQALSVHLRPPVSDGGSFVAGHFSTPSIRLQEITAYCARLAPGLPTLVAGDFNEEEDGDATRFVMSRGMSSVLGRFVPRQPTWRWPTIVGTLHRQLDHVFTDSGLAAVGAEIKEVGRSDHLPVIAILTIAP